MAEFAVGGLPDENVCESAFGNVDKQVRLTGNLQTVLDGCEVDVGSLYLAALNILGEPPERVDDLFAPSDVAEEAVELSSVLRFVCPPDGRFEICKKVFEATAGFVVNVGQTSRRCYDTELLAPDVEIADSCGRGVGAEDDGYVIRSDIAFKLALRATVGYHIHGIIKEMRI